MLAIYRRDPIEDEYKLAVDSFPVLFKECVKHGHVDDDMFERLGFPMDTDVDGTKVSSIMFVDLFCCYIF